MSKQHEPLSLIAGNTFPKFTYSEWESFGITVGGILLIQHVIENTDFSLWVRDLSRIRLYLCRQENDNLRWGIGHLWAQPLLHIRLCP